MERLRIFAPADKSGGWNNDAFVWYGGYGNDTIVVGSEAGQGDVLYMPSDKRNLLWFLKSSDDLVVHRLVGARETITLEDWFTPGSDQIDMFRAAGYVPGNGGAAALANAMAIYLDTHPTVDISRPTAVPVELLNTAGTWVPG